MSPRPPQPAGPGRSIPRPAALPAAVSASLCRQRRSRGSRCCSLVLGAPGWQSLGPRTALLLSPASQARCSLLPLRPALGEIVAFCSHTVAGCTMRGSVLVPVASSVELGPQSLISGGLALPPALRRHAEQPPGTRRPGCPTPHADPLPGAVGAHLSIPQRLQPCAVWTCHCAHLTRPLAGLPSVFIKCIPCLGKGPNRFGQARSSFHEAKAMCVRIPTHSTVIN